MSTELGTTERLCFKSSLESFFTLQIYACLLQRKTVFAHARHITGEDIHCKQSNECYLLQGGVQLRCRWFRYNRFHLFDWNFPSLHIHPAENDFLYFRTYSRDRHSLDYSSVFCYSNLFITEQRVFPVCSCSEPSISFKLKENYTVLQCLLTILCVNTMCS